MREHLKIFLVLVLIFVGTQISCAQKIDAFARVSVTPREGVVRQPYKVTISVHSSTWFAKPLQFANLQIDDAFLIPFTRTVSSINYINNKKYATLSFYYLVFPYNTGTLQIPGLEINASIPPEGGHKGELTTIRTKSQSIKVKPVPSSKNEKVWMVAQNISLKENWSKPLDKLKVGDVVEREITISANGTLPSLIQPLEIEKPEFTSIYPKEPELQDKRNNNEANGIRIEKYSYLFEDEAEVTIPEEVVLWWNPETKRVYKRTIPEQKLTIAANPDLAMMESLKDSLLAMSAPLETEAEEKTLPWTRLGFIAVALLFLGYFGTKSIRIIFIKTRKRKTAYLQSEAYFFKKTANALNHKSSKEFVRQLYIWFDRARKPEQSGSIYSFLNSEEKTALEHLFQNNDVKLTSDQKKKLRVLLTQIRSRILNPSLYEKNTSKLNPV